MRPKEILTRRTRWSRRRNNIYFFAYFASFALKFILVMAIMPCVLCGLKNPFAYALPFNDDMVGGQLITGKVMRPKAEGSVPRNSIDRQLGSREGVMSLVNPLTGDSRAWKSGERLFAVNCTPCHGNYIDGIHQLSDILAKGMPSIDIAGVGMKEKPDGHFFGYIYFGGVALMPAYGWKLSNTEVWEIVSYIRKVQDAR